MRGVQSTRRPVRCPRALRPCDDARDTIRTALELPDPKDPVRAVYDASPASVAGVRATNGSPFTALFNRFIIDSKPMLRDAAG